MPTLPPTQVVTYNRSKQGFCGQLGNGANAAVRFLQTGLSREDLDTVELIESIPGSDRWEVRDLFQRDVDKERVTHAILPYLQDEAKVKFFNPLTLALLPLDKTLRQVERDLPLIQPIHIEEDGHAYTVYECQGYFRFKAHDATPAFSQLDWNDQKVKVVAIDGQHRLSALKRWHKAPDGASSLNSWTIPAVILGISRVTSARAATILEVVRRTFVYINTQAEAVNEARRILLNDESVWA